MAYENIQTHGWPIICGSNNGIIQNLNECDVNIQLIPGYTLIRVKLAYLQ